ncbi:hypothetical protein [Nannocystis punicea]|uniref:Uncharacterized protein n=1 Tax=Nannocystis punicea TaxID=2995304 RepID=A0ABY7H4T9_9BACT|nr:hypothetical protein [Nannocystis poenicansa]WAS94298.1 hypothetical protein O0S08_49890 [Nannocystis poenicansa]
MPRARDALFAAVLIAACPAPDVRPASPTAPNASPPPTQASPPAGRTANNDARGFANQPDYDAEAAALKAQVTPRLPDPPPTDRKQACAAMFAAADALYRDIDPAGSALQLLQASRAADQSACERETSPRAAACVTVLLADRNAELPWLLDQCSRAFHD